MSLPDHPALVVPGHALSVGAIAGTVIGVLPPLLAFIATTCAIVFYVVQLWESDTVQAWYRGREYVRLKRRQVAAAKILKIAQEADAKALAAFQEAEAAALKVRQKATGGNPESVVASPPL